MKALLVGCSYRPSEKKGDQIVKRAYFQGTFVFSRVDQGADHGMHTKVLDVDGEFAERLDLVHCVLGVFDLAYDKRRDFRERESGHVEEGRWYVTDLEFLHGFGGFTLDAAGTYRFKVPPVQPGSPADARARQAPLAPGNGSSVKA